MDIFEALAEPTRRNILERLSNNGHLTVSEIHSEFDMSAPAISQHLKVLREVNLVSVEKQAQKRIYKINPNGMVELEGWIKELTKMWDIRFESLDKLLEIEKKKLSSKNLIKKGI